MPRERKKRLTAKDLQALGATPGYQPPALLRPDGRARLEQLVGEAFGHRVFFSRKLTNQDEPDELTGTSEGSE